MEAEWIIAIPTAGRGGLLGRTLQSLAVSGVRESGALVVVAENGGRRLAESLVHDMKPSFPVEYVAIDVLGKSVALNKIIDLFPKSFIWFLDDDVRVTVDAVKEYSEAFRISAIGKEYYGGPIHVDYERPPPEWLRKYLPRSATGWSMTSQDGQPPNLVFLGANWGAWASDLRAVGGFNTLLGPGRSILGDEPDIQKRLGAAGLQAVYLPEAVVYHWVPKCRCSPWWALRRAYLVGKTEGFQVLSGGPRIHGLPRWMYREIAERAWRAIICQLSRNPEKRFRGLYDLVFFLGWMRGTQLASKANRKC